MNNIRRSYKNDNFFKVFVYTLTLLNMILNKNKIKVIRSLSVNEVVVTAFFNLYYKRQL